MRVDRASICSRLHAKAEPERRTGWQLRGRVAAVEIGGRIDVRVSGGAGMGDRLVDGAAGAASMCDRTALVVPFRTASIRTDPIAGQAIGEGADDRHRAADGGLISELAPLAFREREQRALRDARLLAC